MNHLDSDPNTPPIEIAGLGMVSVLANNAWSTFAALLEGRTMDQRLTHMATECGGAAGGDGAIPLVDLVRYCGSAVVADHCADDPAVELAERAIRQACVEAGVEAKGCAAILGASKGAVGWQSRAAAAMRRGDAVSSRDAMAVALGPHGAMGFALVERLGINLHGSHVAACASGLAALDAARRWMLSPQGPDTCIVATSEAALLPMFIHSYKRLGVLAPATVEGYRQFPLDQRRQGFRLCQLASAVVLRKATSSSTKPRLLDTAIAGEGFDMIRPEPAMPTLSRLAKRLFAKSPVDVLHPHAPGTPEHDPLELTALCACHDQQHGTFPAHIYANKGAIGHGLGAAGLSSLVIAAMCLRSGQVPAMPWLKQPLELPSLGKQPRLNDQPQTCQRDGVHAIFAMGFGGHVAGATIGM